MHEELVFSVDYSRILASVLNLGPNDIARLIAGTSLTPARFLEMEGYLSWPDQHRIISNALALADGPGLGLIAGERYSPLSHGLLGVATMASPTVLDALQINQRFHPTRAQFTRLALEQTPQQLILTFEITVEPDPVATFLMEALLVSLTSTLRFLVGDNVRQVALELAIPEPAYVDRYWERLPFPLRFNCPANRFILPAAFGQLAIPTHDSQLQRWATQQIEQQFERLHLSTRFGARVLAILRQTPGQSFSQEQVAFMLNLSPRTLVRRLKEEGTSYKQLLDDEQKRLAQYYLEHTDLTAEAIAEQTGYHDLSSFRRAFKRWFGMAPSRYPRKPVT